MQSAPQVSQECTVGEGEVPLALTGVVPLARVAASEELTGRDDFAVVWYMLERSSRDAGAAEGPACDLALPLAVGPAALLGRVPGCKDCNPLGVSKTTRK